MECNPFCLVFTFLREMPGIKTGLVTFGNEAKKIAEYVNLSTITTGCFDIDAPLG